MTSANSKLCFIVSRNYYNNYQATLPLILPRSLNTISLAFLCRVVRIAKVKKAIYIYILASPN